MITDVNDLIQCYWRLKAAMDTLVELEPGQGRDFEWYPGNAQFLTRRGKGFDSQQ